MHALRNLWLISPIWRFCYLTRRIHWCIRDLNNSSQYMKPSWTSNNTIIRLSVQAQNMLFSYLLLCTILFFKTFSCSLADIFHNAVVITQVVFTYYCYVFEAVFVLFLLITRDGMKVWFRPALSKNFSGFWVFLWRQSNR